MIGATAGHFSKTDTADVFTIVFPEFDQNGNMTRALKMQPNGTNPLLKNLFSKYSTLKVKELAASCIWYAAWVDETTSPWICENLSLTHNYLLNHMDKDLWSEVQEDMAAYENTSARGGRMIFSIMMRHLQANSQLVVTSLCSKLKAINIKDYNGEDFSVAVTHIRSVVKCLQSLKLTDHNGVVRERKVPDDLLENLCQVSLQSGETVKGK